MTLLELQRKTMAAVTQPLTKDYAMRSRTLDSRSMQTEAASFIKPNDRLSSFERLEIYNRQYWFRLISALTEDFPGVAALLGDSAFEKLAIRYIIDNPSRSFTLRDLGRHLETWIPTYSGNLDVERALLADVAKLEWAHIEAFDRADERPLSLEQMQLLGDDSRLSLQPHVQLLSLEFPVDNFVVAVHRSQDEPEMASNAVTKRRRVPRKRHMRDLRPEKIYLAVHRSEEFIYYKRLDHYAYQILASIKEGNTLGEALGSVAEQSQSDPDSFMQSVQQWFANWGELGWLVPPRVQPAPGEQG